MTNAYPIERVSVNDMIDFESQFNEPNGNEGYYGYIYITTNKVNGKIYIGKRKSKNFLTDFYIGSGKVLRKAIAKYGEDNFDIDLIGWYETKEELNKAERFWIAYYNSQDRSIGYNRTEGGDWGDVTVGMTDSEYQDWLAKKHRSGYHLTDDHKRKLRESNLSKHIISEETRQRLRESHLGNTWSDESKAKMRATIKSNGGPHNKGRHLSNETKKKLSDSKKGKAVHSEEHKRELSESFTGKGNPFYGKTHSEETKRKISEAIKERYKNSDGPRKGCKLSDEQKIKISNSLKGRKISEETRRRRSESLRGKVRSEETKKKMRESRKGKLYKRVCLSCNSEFYSSGTRTKYCNKCKNGGGDSVD